MNPQLPCLMVLVFQLSRIDSKKMENSGPEGDNTHWKDIDVTGASKKNGLWENITQWLGRELCKGKSAEHPFTCEDFKEFVMPIVGATAMRVSCEGDKALNGAIVCWLREKTWNQDTYSKKTTFEVQFWSDHPKMSHCRTAAPSVYARDVPAPPNTTPHTVSKLTTN